MKVHVPSFRFSPPTLRALLLVVLLVFAGTWFASPVAAHGLEAHSGSRGAVTAERTHTSAKEKLSTAAAAVDDCVPAEPCAERCPCCPPGGLSHCHHGSPLLFTGVAADHAPSFGGSVTHDAAPPGGIVFALQSGLTRPPAI